MKPRVTTLAQSPTPLAMCDFVARLADGVPFIGVPALCRARIIVIGKQDRASGHGLVRVDAGAHTDLGALAAMRVVGHVFGIACEDADDTNAVRGAVGAPADAPMTAYELPRGRFHVIHWETCYLQLTAFLVGCRAAEHVALPPFRAMQLSASWHCEGVSVDVHMDGGPLRRRYDAVAIRALRTDTGLPERIAVEGADPDPDLEHGGWQVFDRPLRGFTVRGLEHAPVETYRFRFGCDDVPYRRWKGLRRAFIAACVSSCVALVPSPHFTGGTAGDFGRVVAIGT